MASMTVKMEGLNELRMALQRLPREIQAKVLPRAVSKGAQVIAKDAKARAPELSAPDPRRTPGLLKRMIRATSGVRRGTEATAFVSVRRLSKAAISRFKKSLRAAGARVKGANNPNDPFYWRFLEFGTSKMAARPFLRPAFDSKKREAADRIIDVLREGIEAEAPKAGGKRF